MTETTLAEEFAEYNVEEYNNETEADNFGTLGPVARLLPGLAESLLKSCSEPDVVFRRILKDDDGVWNVDYDLSVSIYYPGNSRQTMFAAVESFKDEDDGNDHADYYQLTYAEVVPRVKLVMESRKGTDERWFISQLNNEQLRGWFAETGIIRMSNCALNLLEDKQHETVRNKHGGSMEPRPESAND